MKSSNNPLWFPCNMGMHQEYARTAAPPGTIYSCTNSRLDTNGVLVKRGGHVALAASTNLPSEILITGDGSLSFVEKATFLRRIGDAPCVGTTMGAVFCMDQDSANTFHVQGRHSTAKPLGRRTALTGTELSSSSTGYGARPIAQALNSSGYLMYAAVKESLSCAYKIENSEGVAIYSDVRESTDKVQVIAVGATFYLITQQGTAVNAMSFSYNGTSVTVGTETQVATLTSSSSHWDASAFNTTHWFLVHQNGATTIRIDRMSGTTSTHNASITVAGTCPVSIFASTTVSSSVWVGWYNDPTVAGNVRYRVYAAADLTLVLTTTTLVSATDVYGPPLFGVFRSARPGSAGLSSSTCFFAFRYVEVAGEGRRGMRYGTAQNDGTTQLASNTLWHVLPVSKPDDYNRIWVLTDHAELTVQRFALLRFAIVTLGTEQVPVIELVTANMAGTFGSTFDPSVSSMWFHAIATGSASSFFGLPFILNQVSGSPFARVELYEYETSAQNQYWDSESLGAILVTAGQPVAFPASPWSQLGTLTNRTSGGAEIGFLHPPEIYDAAVVTTGTVQSFSYRAVYEFADSLGRRHRSAPSAPVAVTTAAGTPEVNLDIITMEVTQRENSARSFTTLVLYRTLNGGTTYHRLSGAAVASDSTDGTITRNDNQADSAIDDNEILYTDGGVLENTMAPSCRFLARSEDRLWCGGLWDKQVIQCSKIILPEEEFQFTDHPAFQVTLLGDCTGIAYMDGSIVAFTADEIYLISGDGPNDQGIGNFPPPRKLAQGIGCIDYRSIVETNIGTFFQSRRGIELLPRGFGPIEYVGRAVRDVFQSDGLTEVIASGVRMGPKDNTVRFMVKDPDDSSTQTVLVYDIDRGEWVSKDRLHFACSNMGVWPDGFAWASTDFNSGTFSFPFLYENGSQFGDYSAGDTAYVGQTIQLNRIYPFGSPAHWGNVNKVQVCVDSIDAAAGTLQVSVQTDANPVRDPTFTGLSATGVQRREVNPPIRQCSGVTITIVDGSGGTGSAGHRFLGLALDVSTEGGIAPVNPNNNERA